MATAEECRTALDEFANQLNDNPEAVRSRGSFNRRLACEITDLGIAFHGQFKDGRLVDITDGDDPQAQIRMIVSGDNLLKLVAGELDFMAAYTTGKVKLKANFMDLMKLRNML